MFYNSYKKLQPALNDVKIRNLRRLSAKIFVAIATACLRLHSQNCIKILSNICKLVKSGEKIVEANLSSINEIRELKSKFAFGQSIWVTTL